jgi:hypothetical protein
LCQLLSSRSQRRGQGGRQSCQSVRRAPDAYFRAPRCGRRRALTTATTPASNPRGTHTIATIFPYDHKQHCHQLGKSASSRKARRLISYMRSWGSAKDGRVARFIEPMECPPVRKSRRAISGTRIKLDGYRIEAVKSGARSYSTRGVEPIFLAGDGHRDHLARIAKSFRSQRLGYVTSALATLPRSSDDTAGPAYPTAADAFDRFSAGLGLPLATVDCEDDRSFSSYLLVVCPFLVEHPRDVGTKLR